MNRKFFLIFVFFTLVGLRSVSVFGVNITQSQLGNLSNSDQYFRLVFVTSTTTTATSADQTSYDAFVTDHTDGTIGTITYESSSYNWQAIISVIMQPFFCKFQFPPRFSS